jgi:hypothetical protein
MAFTSDDLRDFTHYAEAHLKDGVADSIAQLANRWERERAALNAEKPVAVFDPTQPLEEQIAGGGEVILGARDLREALGRKGGVTTAELLAKAAAVAKDAGR